MTHVGTNKARPPPFFPTRGLCSTRIPTSDEMVVSLVSWRHSIGITWLLSSAITSMQFWSLQLLRLLILWLIIQKHPCLTFLVKRILIPALRILFLFAMLLVCEACKEDVPHGLSEMVVSMKRISEVASDESRLLYLYIAGVWAHDGDVPSLFWFSLIPLQVYRTVAPS